MAHPPKVILIVLRIKYAALVEPSRFNKNIFSTRNEERISKCFSTTNRNRIVRTNLSVQYIVCCASSLEH